MYNRREILLMLSAVGCVCALPGCVTSMLFEENRYAEIVSSVLISEDEKKIVIITRDFHYIFDAVPTIVAALKGSFHKSVSARMDTLYVESDGNASIKFRLYLAEHASDQKKSDALGAGFVKGEDGLISTQGELRGVRYRSGGIKASDKSVPLNRSYEIDVVVRQSPGEKVGKALLTPITVVADGVLFIGSIPLIIYVMWACGEGRCK